MERKIGDIFKYNGEWYQCVEGNCAYCSLKDEACEQRIINDVCKLNRIFKKLEKVREPYEYFVQHKGIVMLQPYKLFTTPIINGAVCNVNYDTNTIDLEIKQNKEDMEEKNKAEGLPLLRLVGKYMNSLIDYATFEKAVKDLYSNKEESKPLKEFDLEAAKKGKPVCTRGGRKARIICFDLKNDEYPIVVAITNNGEENEIHKYSIDGKICTISTIKEDDLMMLPEKKEGWVNIYALNPCYSSKEEAEANIDRDYEHEYVRTVKIEWEE